VLLFNYWQTAGNNCCKESLQALQRKKLFSSPRDAAQVFFSPSAFQYLSLQGSIKGMYHTGIMTHIVDILAQFFLDNFHLYPPKTFRHCQRGKAHHGISRSFSKNPSRRLLKQSNYTQIRLKIHNPRLDFVTSVLREKGKTHRGDHVKVTTPVAAAFNKAPN